MTVLAIDPGREKCGLAIATPLPETPRASVLHREIVETPRLVARVLQLLGSHTPDRILLGDGTQSAPLLKALRAALPDGPEVVSVPEAFTSQRARERYQAECLPRGLWRLVPQGMRTPPRAYDDYVAVILAEDYFARGLAGETPPGTGG